MTHWRDKLRRAILIAVLNKSWRKDPMAGENKGYPTAADIPAERWPQLGITPAAFDARRAGRLEREKSAPNVGDMAPDFAVERLAGK